MGLLLKSVVTDDDGDDGLLPASSTTLVSTFSTTTLPRDMEGGSVEALLGFCRKVENEDD